MANTLEVIKFRDVLRVNSIPRLVPGVPVETVELVGDDFSSAEEVFINEVKVPEFVIVNSKTIYAQLPDNVNQVRTISVLSGNFTITQGASKVSFSIGDKSKRISGVLKLTQLFVKWLLTSPGSDILDRSMGGGLQDIVGQLSSSHRSDRTLGLVSQAISTTATQIRRAQMDVPKLPLNERLMGAEITDLQFEPSQDEARVRVAITSVAGVTGVAAVLL